MGDAFSSSFLCCMSWAKFFYLWTRIHWDFHYDDGVVGKGPMSSCLIRSSKLSLVRNEGEWEIFVPWRTTWLADRSTILFADLLTWMKSHTSNQPFAWINQDTLLFRSQDGQDMSPSAMLRTSLESPSKFILFCSTGMCPAGSGAHPPHASHAPGMGGCLAKRFAIPPILRNTTKHMAKCFTNV